MAAALATGARAVGVATGNFTEQELIAAGAHAVLPDLSDTARVESGRPWVLGRRQGSLVTGAAEREAGGPEAGGPEVGGPEAHGREAHGRRLMGGRLMGGRLMGGRLMGGRLMGGRRSRLTSRPLPAWLHRPLG